MFREPEREDVLVRGKETPTVREVLKSSKAHCNCLFYDITADPHCPCCCGAAFDPRNASLVTLSQLKPISVPISSHCITPQQIEYQIDDPQRRKDLQSSQTRRNYLLELL
jgi:hypothetical protein